MNRSSRLRRLIGPLALGLVACGGSGSASSAPKTAGQNAQSEAARPASRSSLSRTSVKRAIDDGVGRFLSEVTLEDLPVMREGRFHGFRIRAIHAEWGVDLRSGDVVTKVNGLPIERPELADAALRSLAKAKSLRVDFERDGKPKVLELPIIEDAPAQAAPKRAQ